MILSISPSSIGVNFISLRLMKRLLIVFSTALACCLSSFAQSLEDVKSVAGAEGQIIRHENYTVSYNPQTKQSNWVSWSTSKEELASVVSRKDYSFSPDPKVKIAPVTSMDYSRSGWDRGHMCPAADNKYSATAMAESFYMTNICPQNHTLNEKTWNYLETACRNWAQSGVVYVVCGPLFNGKTTTHIGNARVAVPDAFWKVVLRFYKGSWKGVGFVMPNSEVSDDISQYACSINDVERLTGFDFFSTLDDSYEESVESVYDMSFWPHSRH